MIDTDKLVERVKLRFLPNEVIPQKGVIEEYLLTISDRLAIRLNADEVPPKGLSIVVDATLKALRLRGYEGSKSETISDGGSVANSFIDDVLDAYSAEIDSLKYQQHAGTDGVMGVRFF